MKWAFLISGIIELLGALLCYLQPDVLVLNGTPYLIRLYGINALVLGIINLVLFVNYQENRLTKFIFLTMMFFHGAVAMMTNGSDNQFLPYKLEATLTHLVLFVVFLFFYMKDLKPDNK